MELEAALKSRLAQIRLLAMDVDGVLTDGAFAYDNEGGESKRFHVADGLGIVLLRLRQVEVAWISGRKKRDCEPAGAGVGRRQCGSGYPRQARGSASAFRGACYPFIRYGLYRR